MSGDLNQGFRGGGRSVEFLDEVNAASLVMLVDTGILPREVGVRIARAVSELRARDLAAPARTTADYLDYEPRLLEIGGAEASRLHTGRSRQDLASTLARMNLRDALLRALEAVCAAREALVATAASHEQTLVPTYTHGVQAQPTTFAHYLLAVCAMLGRSGERLREAWARVNACPLGTGALATSSFPLDRERLADLLGFEGLVENAYDANQFASVDCAMEVACALQIVAVQAGQFAQDMHAPYAHPRPWLLLRTGELTGVSSIMPQKRNPAAIEQLRAQASLLLSDLHSVGLLAHNTRTGMFDYRMYDPVPSARALTVLGLIRRIVEGLVVDPRRALSEIREDYSTTTEIADALLARADVPFRTGHHFASRLTDHGRSRGLRLHDIDFADAQRLYREQTGDPLPLDEAQFREVTSPEYMVHGRRGRGGPQVPEVRRMHALERAAITADRQWLAQQHERLAQAARVREKAFAALAAG
jgi:argininosuccinate lyase